MVIYLTTLLNIFDVINNNNMIIGVFSFKSTSIDFNSLHFLYVVDGRMPSQGGPSSSTNNPYSIQVGLLKLS